MPSVRRRSYLTMSILWPRPAGVERLMRLFKNFARQSRAEPVRYLSARCALDAPPASIERLHRRPGLGIRVGICHRLPSGAPRGVNVVAPNLAVAIGPAHHNPRRLYDAGIGRRHDGKREQQCREEKRYASHRNLPLQFIGIVGERGPPTAPSIVGPTNYTSEVAGNAAAPDGDIFP